MTSKISVSAYEQRTGVGAQTVHRNRETKNSSALQDLGRQKAPCPTPSICPKPPRASGNKVENKYTGDKAWGRGRGGEMKIP